MIKLTAKEREMAYTTLTMWLFITVLTYFSGASALYTFSLSCMAFFLSYLFFYLGKPVNSWLLSVIPALFILINAAPYYIESDSYGLSHAAGQETVSTSELQGKTVNRESVYATVEQKNKLSEIKTTYDEEVY